MVKTSFVIGTAWRTGKPGHVAGAADHALLDIVTSRNYIELMRTVGIRELKSKLSELVKRASAGEDLLVTDRGLVVAALGPPGSLALDQVADPGVERLVRAGLMVRGATNDPQAYPPLTALLDDGMAARLLDDERGNR